MCPCVGVKYIYHYGFTKYLLWFTIDLYKYLIHNASLPRPVYLINRASILLVYLYLCGLLRVQYCFCIKTGDADPDPPGFGLEFFSRARSG